MSTHLRPSCRRAEAVQDSPEGREPCVPITRGCSLSSPWAGSPVPEAALRLVGGGGTLQLCVAWVRSLAGRQSRHFAEALLSPAAELQFSPATPGTKATLRSGTPWAVSWVAWPRHSGSPGQLLAGACSVGWGYPA